jgi:hypothetical protein
MHIKINHKPILLVLIYLFAAFLWTTCTSYYLARAWNWDVNRVNPVPMWIAQIISIPLLAFFFWLLSSIWNTVKEHPKKLLVFLTYSLIFSLFFMSVAPGCFSEDTYYTFHMVRNGWWGGWYSALHPALITALIQILPWYFFAPSLFLAAIWALIYSGAHLSLSALNAPKVLHCAIVPFVFVPAQLASTVILVRDSYFTAGFILFLGVVFYLLAIRKKVTIWNVFVVSLLGSFLMFYRSDATPSVVLAILLVVIVVCWRSHLASCWKALLSAVVPVIIFYTIASLPAAILKDSWVRGNSWENRAELEYKLTLIENPLGYIVKNNGIISESQRSDIENVFKISDLRDKSCPQNLCLFYGGYWNKSSTKEERNLAYKAALMVFAGNPKLFLQSRYETLSTVGDKNTQTICSSELMLERGFDRLWPDFEVNGMGERIYDFIRNTETSAGIAGGKFVWWNVYIAVIILIILMGISYWAPVAGLVSFLLFVRTLVVFLAAPAGFSVYYLTLFIGAPLMLIFGLAEVRYRISESLNVEKSR